MRYCEEYAALLDPYVDGELPGEELALVRAHLEHCPGCRAYVDGAFAIRAAFPDVEETAVPEDFARGVMAAVRAEEAVRKGAVPSGKRKSIYWKKALLPLAACVAIVLAVRADFFPGGGFGDGNNTAAPAAAMDDDVSSPGGEVPYSLGSAAPQADTEDSAAADTGGLSAAPASRIMAETPAVSGGEDPYAPFPEADGAMVMPTEAGRQSAIQARAVRITAVQAGEALAEMAYTLGEDGVRCYQLTTGEFDALLETLAERDVVPELWEDAPELEVLSQGYDLVYVTEE